MDFLHGSRLVVLLNSTAVCRPFSRLALLQLMFPVSYRRVLRFGCVTSTHGFFVSRASHRSLSLCCALQTVPQCISARQSCAEIKRSCLPAGDCGFQLTTAVCFKLESGAAIVSNKREPASGDTAHVSSLCLGILINFYLVRFFGWAL